MSDTDITPVIFRRWKKRHGGEVIAIFPADLAGYQAHEASCYQHVGQHGTVDMPAVIRCTKPAKDDDPDVLALRRELERAPYRYRLQIYRRDNRVFQKKRAADAEQLRRRERP